MRTYWIVIVSGMLLWGCLGTSGSSPVADPAAVPEVRQEVPLTARIREGAAVSLHEAMARAIRSEKYYDAVRRMKSGLLNPQPDGSQYAPVAEAAASAGYGLLRKVRAARHLADPVLRKQADWNQDILQLWEVMDFGLSHAAVQRMRLSDQEIEQKVLHNIMEEVRTLYYGVAGAEALLPEIDHWIEQGRETIREARVKAAAAPSDAAADVIRRLIENNRTLWELSQSLSRDLTLTRSKLAQRIGLPPESRFTIAGPDWEREEIRLPALNLKSLEYLALGHRPESGGAVSAARVEQAREMLLQTVPGIDFNAGGANRDWWHAGSQVTMTLLREAGKRDNVTQDAAIIGQVHLARLYYDRSAKFYHSFSLRKGRLPAIDGDTPPGPETVLAAGDALIAGVRQHMAYAALQNAAERVYRSVGIAPLPTHSETMSADALAEALRQSVREWPDLLTSAYASAEKGVKPPPSLPGPETDHAGQTASAASPGSVPAAGDVAGNTAAAVKARFEKRDMVVTDVAEAVKKGQKPVKEVSIFRDVVTIYTEPHQNAPVKGQGLIGERYKLLGWAPNGWLKVEMGDGSPGWMPTKYARPVDNGYSYATDWKKEETTGTEAPEKKAEADLMHLVTVKRTNVRSGPGFDFQVRYIEAIGVRYRVSDSSGDWFKIEAKDGAEGWVHKTVVSVEP
ncbi:hypothetical protein DENIS_0010 [Desulfonema ishimotonii]|uniref:SH3b domain-containing protein n=1 Tax=Desulfonema ishimotonii TaxID=45657 RepID=A0A401FQ49_9BACT|nr:SH3 domain-containing protein [Desulfonema ishimotonii]GBC59080.1 hypothetical protein DENIS_0010 [Desulfonema ishimotonii]